jgi:hypothetical protein
MQQPDWCSEMDYVTIVFELVKLYYRECPALGFVWV